MKTRTFSNFKVLTSARALCSAVILISISGCVPLVGGESIFSVLVTPEVSPTPSSSPSAASLVFATQPSATGTAGTALSTQPVIELQDSLGAVLSTATDTVTLGLYSDSSCSTAAATAPDASASLSGTVALAASSGVVTFTNVAIKKASSALYLKASATGYNSACSSLTNISAGAVSATASSLAVSATTVVSGASITATLTAKDAYGNSNPSGVTTRAFASTSTAGTGTFSAITNVGSGVYTSSFTGVLAGATTLSATLNGSAVTQTQAVTITVGSSSKLVFATQPASTGTPDSALSTQPVVEIRDSADNVITNATDTVALTVFSDNTCTTAVTTAPDATSSIAGTSSMAAVSGVATFTNVAIHKAASTLYLKAASGSLTSACSTVTNISPGAVSATASALAVSASTVASASSITVTLTAKDAYGNTNPSGITARAFSSTAVGGTGTFSAITDVGSGVYTSSFTGVLAGAVTISATLNTVAVTQTQAVTVTAAATATQLAISGAPASVTAGTASSITVTAKDAAGNTVAGYSGTVTITSSDGAAVLPSASTLTSGSKAFGFTLKTAGTKTVTAGDGTLTVTSSNITVNPAAISAAQSTLAISAATVKAGLTKTITITAKDAYGNTNPSGITMASFALGQSYTGGTITIGAISSAGSGVYNATLTGNVAGLLTVNGTYGGTALANTADITVLHGDASSLSFTNSTFDGLAGNSFDIDVTAIDDYGNIDTAATPTVTLTTDDPQAVLPAAAALVSGAKTFNVMLKSSDNTLGFSPTLTANATGLTGSVSIAVSANVISRTTTTFTVSKNAIATGEKLQVSAYPKDAYGNLFPSGLDANLTLGMTSTLVGGNVGFDVFSDQGDGSYLVDATGGNPGTATLGLTVDGIAIAHTESVTIDGSSPALGNGYIEIAGLPKRITRYTGAMISAIAREPDGSISTHVDGLGLTSNPLGKGSAKEYSHGNFINGKTWQTAFYEADTGSVINNGFTYYDGNNAYYGIASATSISSNDTTVTPTLVSTDMGGGIDPSAPVTVGNAAYFINRDSSGNDAVFKTVAGVTTQIVGTGADEFDYLDGTYRRIIPGETSIFFVARQVSDHVTTLYQYDGSTVHAIYDSSLIDYSYDVATFAHSEARGVFGKTLLEVGSKTYFVAMSKATRTYQVFSYDGTSITEHSPPLHKDYTDPGNLTKVGTSVYFTAHSGYDLPGEQDMIFQISGSTVTRYTTNHGAGYYNCQPNKAECFVGVVGGEVFFYLRDEVSAVLRLFKSDGAGTLEFVPGTKQGEIDSFALDSRDPFSFTMKVESLGSSNYYFEGVQTHHTLRKLLVWDGNSSNPVTAIEMAAGEDDKVYGLSRIGAYLYFTCAFPSSDPNYGSLVTLCRYDEGHGAIYRIFDESSGYSFKDPAGSRFEVVGTSLYFTANPFGVGTVKLFRYDGTQVTWVSNVRYNAEDSFVTDLSDVVTVADQMMYAIGSNVYFVVNNEERTSGAWKIYRYDGETVQRVAEIRQDSDDLLQFLSASSSALYFKAIDLNTGNQAIYEYAP